MDSFYKWLMVEKRRQVLHFKFESTIPQDQVDGVKMILSFTLSIIALSSINYVYKKDCHSNGVIVHSSSTFPESAYLPLIFFYGLPANCYLTHLHSMHVNQ